MPVAGDGLGWRLFVVKANGVDQGRLPVAHTCTNALEVPAYESLEVLRERLVTAIEGESVKRNVLFFALVFPDIALVQYLH